MRGSGEEPGSVAAYLGSYRGRSAAKEKPKAAWRQQWRRRKLAAINTLRRRAQACG